MAGLPPLAGFWAKDEVLAVTADHQNPVVLLLVLISVVISATT
jgi:NADH:ubiquinone oxidoreductase subunit 2 (subunit N)